MSLLFVLLICIALTSGQNREVNEYINPGCPKNLCVNNTSPLIHVETVGSNDTIHHVWDFTKKPTILLALADLNSNLTVDWEQFLSNNVAGSVDFSPEPKYVFAIVLDKVIEFDDVNNTGLYDSNNTNKDYIHTIDTTSFSWTFSKNESHSDAVTFVLTGALNDIRNGSIEITLTAYGNKEHSDTQPHLLHTSNATQIDVVFNKLKTHFNHSRFALGVVVVNTNKDRWLYQTQRNSLDDEHSPGIFTVSEVLTPNEELQHGYLQWRKVAYTSSDRIMTNSTDVTDYTAFQVSKPVEALNGTLVFAYFGEQLVAQAVNYMFVSFGTQDDGYYVKTRYTSWTLLAGIGYPAEESFSMLVILILSIGLLGIPVLIIAFGVLYLIARRISNTRDDLLSSQ